MLSNDLITAFAVAIIIGLMMLVAAMTLVFAKIFRTTSPHREAVNPFDCTINKTMSDDLPDCLPCIEPFPAGAFICDACGKYNFFSMIAVRETNMSDEDFQKMKLRLTSCSMDENNLYIYPAQVQCADCRTVYAIKLPQDTAIETDLPPDSE